MHISDGLLPTYAWAAGAAAAGLLVAADARRLRDRDIPKLALLASAFFVCSLVPVPVGPASVHLTLNGLVGVVAGPGTALVIAMGLFLQALLFGHGGLTTLGVNVLNMGLPAVLVGAACRMLLRTSSVVRGAIAAGLAGALAPAMSLAMVVGWAAVASDPAYRTGLRVFVWVSVPLCFLEGLICGATVSYLLRVQPSVLGLSGGVMGSTGATGNRPARPGP